MNAAVRVRRAEPGDVAAMLALIVALAVYEREPDAVRATDASLRDTLFGTGAQVFAHVATADETVVGVALWFQTYSTWTGRPSLYLEDLFVTEAARGAGAGRALFKALAQEAIARDCARIDWAVLDWNATAAGFYAALGARPASGWQPWRLEGAALVALAGGEAAPLMRPTLPGG